MRLGQNVMRWAACVFALAGSVTSFHVRAACDFPPAVCAAQHDFEQADTLLTDRLDAIFDSIGSGVFGDYLVEPMVLKDSLKRSQTAWIHYRQAHCAAVFSLMSGGSSRHEDELRCLTALTQARERQLSSLYDVDAR